MDNKIEDGPRAEHVHEHTPSREHLRQLSPAELEVEKKLRKKIDLRIMPICVLVYLMNYIDRSNYAAARLQGLQNDLGMTDEQYQIGLSTLFVGYVLMQVPSNALLNHAARPSIYIGFFTCVWGLVSACTSLVTTPAQIIACRFLLGFVEAPFFPGILFYLSKWYTKAELSLRMAVFFSGSLISGAFGNLIAAGILDGLAGVRGYAAWQWLYIIEGVVTIACGLLLMLLLPDFPDTWAALSALERRVATRRLAADAAVADIDDIDDDSGGPPPPPPPPLRGVRLALVDPKTYLLAAANHGHAGASGIQNYFPTLTQTVAADRVGALLLCAPPYLFMVGWSFAHARLSDRAGRRFWFYVYPIPITIVGFVVFMTTSSFAVRYFSLFLQIFVCTMNCTIYAWIASSLPRPPAKRAAALAFINAAGSAASIWTPFTYRARDRPFYRPALACCVALQCVAAASALGLRAVLARQNARLARMEEEEEEEEGNADAGMRPATAVAAVAASGAEARSLRRGFRYVI